MRERKFVSVNVVFAIIIHISYGCQIPGHTLWTIAIATNILDTLEVGETVISRATTDIEDIINVSYGQATLGGPYFDLSIENSQFIVRTNNAFERYEEIEVASRVVITVDFSCTGGTTRGGLLLWIDIIDTNNNAPEFIPSNEFEFVITPPLPPDFLITGCFNDVITVKDIDLTTYRIDFTIEDNPYFEIEFSEEATTVAKEFVGHIRTKTFVRSLSEPLTLIINATDVDNTTGPAQTATGTVRIVADSEFQFPEEPVFEQAFYLANYTDDHQLNLLETISLRQGFDEYVNFTLEGERFEYFDIRADDNQVTLVVRNPLPSEYWSQRQIYLIVRAEKELTSGATTTVIVQLPEEIKLQFGSVFYEGVIANNVLQLAPLDLSQGYEGVTVTAVTVGEYSTYFSATVQANLVTLTMAPLDDVIDNNNFISLQVVAASDRSSASTVVNLEIIKDDNNTPVFDQSIYSGRYDPVTGLTMDQVRFVQGFDSTVAVTLTGENSDFFQIVEIGPVMTITSSTIPPELFNQQNILITIEASKPRTVGAKAIIHVALPAARELEFEESTYRGSIEGSLFLLQPIVLHQGYEEGVSFSLSGEYSTYFTATNERELVTIVPTDSLPDIAITQNSVIMLTLAASGLNAIPTTTSVLLDIIKEDTTTPVFSQPIYYGTYSGGVIDIEAINLTQGFDSSVSFRIDGAHAQYFAVGNDSENNVVITLQLPITEDVIFSEKVLLFNVLADKALTVGANAAVLISFPTELTDSAIMRFSQNIYIGNFEENELHLEDIVLDTGFEPGTEFIISGEYIDHFTWTITDNIVQISSLNTLTAEVLQENNLIVLEIEARRPRAVSVWTSVVLDIIKQEVIAPVFGQAYYTGSYTEETGLTFEETINLSEGYDGTVTFALIGEPEAWFAIVQEGETLNLVSRVPVPLEILQSYNQLLFSIVANKPNAISGRAVISLDLPKDFTDSSFRFQQDFYKGHLENGFLVLSDIILGDYTSDVNYTYTGEYVDNFQLTNQNGTFTMHIETPLSNEELEKINVFVFTLEAQNTIIRTHTVIIIENIKETTVGDQHVEFEEPYYIGKYSTENLQFDAEIRLASETNENVTFDLEGEDAAYFGLVRNENAVTLTLTNSIPAAVIANNQQLVFVVTAQRPGSATARATIVIALVDSIPDGSPWLGFDRVTYLGYIENNQTNIPAITLSEGFTPNVEFDLRGELEEYFGLSLQGAVVTVSLQSVIPEHLIPANRIIVLEIQASAPQAVTAYATIVIEYVAYDDIGPVVELIFAQTFYSGSYATAEGLTFPTAISLTQGYESDVQFALEGDDAVYFGVVRNENAVSLTLTNSIPAAVIANNLQLVFVVTAQRPGSATARATVVIALVDSIPEGSPMLGFDRVTYFGNIENNQTNIPAITLSEGFTPNVEFDLRGELEEYFGLSLQGAVVTVSLQSVIPEHLIPANRIIVLEIQASAPQAVTAYATIVIEYVAYDDIGPVVELIFAQTFYSGSYATAEGLTFPTAISLTQGYESDVQFALEGDDAVYFGVVRNENAVTLTLTNSIPAAVIANNQQLVFVVTAQRPGSATARATVVIALVDSIPEGSPMLGFDRVTYFGNIENNQTNIPAITLSEGFTPNVEFDLRGELEEYFGLSLQGAVVTVSLQSVIPEHLIPANRIIVLEIQASAPQAVTAYATIVIEYVAYDDIGPVVELIFAQTFYSGSYATAEGLTFPTAISLTQGYESDVQFALEGDDAVYFGVVRNENAVSLTLTNSIPAAVIANNLQLVFVVTAQRPGSATARATVVIALVDSIPEGSPMLGFDRVTYFGNIENNQTNIPAITLSEGFTPNVEFDLRGELEEYFGLSLQGAVVTVSLQSVIPEHLIPANRIIVLEIQASAPQAVTAYATIVIEYVAYDDIGPVVELIFAQTFYSGSYATAEGLTFPTAISLTQGYESDVQFALEGDDAVYFGVVRNENAVTLTLTNSIPAAVIANNQQLVFVVTAQRPGSATARATVVIALVDSIPEGSPMLGFDRVTYFGNIENNQTNIPAITLSEGFTPNVEFDLRGELEEYFGLSLQGAVVTVSLQSVIPEHLIPANRIIVLEIQASAPQAVTAYATIVIEYVAYDDIGPVVELIFAQTFYSGSYATAEGLTFPTAISLTQGYESDVQFALEGDDAVYFGVVRNENAVTLTLTNSIPAAVIANNQQLVFVVTAQRPGSATARATVVIALVDSIPEGSPMLGFDRVTYFGNIENNQTNIPAITLSEGFTPNVEFDLRGELEEYFGLSLQGAVVTVSLQSVIPEHLIPANRIIVLEIQASAPQAVTAYATIVIEYVAYDDIGPVVELIFAQTFYSGSYATAEGLTFPTAISLTQGYESDVQFALEGDDAVYFGVVRNENAVTLTLTNSIPAAVIANNQQLVFVVTAQRPGSATARATVVIALVDSIPEGSPMLGFDRVTYFGNIENNQTNIPAITLSEGFTPNVEFDLRGELEEYFGLSLQGAVVTVSLQSVIPEHLIPANRIIVLEIQASAPQAVTAYATIVIEYVAYDDIGPVVELIFAQTFYSGSYATAEGLTFPTAISLTQGYESDVQFALEGDDAVYFGVVRNENAVTLTLTNSIPAAVIANNQQLVFVVTAQRPGSATARATVVIALVDSIPEGSPMLGFDRVTYFGNIENNQTNIPAITLSEGFTPNVEFDLRGELEEYFGLSPQGAVVTVSLQSVIPEHLIPANRIIVLEIQASAPQAVTAYATIVIEYVAYDDIGPVVELIFAQTFYSGSYATAEGLTFPTAISLTQGYESDVQFALEGDDAVYFGVVRNENAVTLTLTNSIPAAVIANNQQLVFVVTAQRPGSATARATVVIALVDSIPEGSPMLGFDRVTYFGNIENNQTNIPAITLSEGFTPNVEFDLRGELEEYFGLSPQGAVVTVSLQSVIPEHLIPANRIIVLEIQASAPQAVTAYATIVIEYVAYDDIGPVVELIFAQTFYSGSYATAEGLTFPTAISLTQGYESDVQFALEGDDAVYFGVVRNENAVTLTLTNSIPAAVIANNQQLVFVVTAQRPGSATARATVVIALVDSIPEGSPMLGFDRVTYFGNIENNQTNIPAITLSEGFTPNVEFDLRGELEEYFGLSLQGAVVTVSLQSVIPEHLIPANRIIVLEIQASAPQAVTAYATIVIEYVAYDDIGPVVELIFAQTFYSGSYATAEGLTFPTAISLTQGYESDVQFALEGDDAVYFGVVRNENAVTLTLTNSIPAAVIANNQQLVFVVTAQRPGSATARATVVIALVDYSQPESDVTFEKILYEGVVQNGVVIHDIITVIGFSGSSIELHGEYSSSFATVISYDRVTVSASSSFALPSGITHVALELRAGTASAVLVLNVEQIDDSATPNVTFTSPSYAVRVDVSQTGLVGQVQASADNGEAVSYSLQLDNAHLQERLVIDNEGRLYLSAPLNSGFYTFAVVATSIVTQTQGTATVLLSVEAITVCDDKLVMPPLIVLDVDEEEAHYDLINGTRYDDCHLTLSNRWPLNQTWVYVDETGLHTIAIDREHESIAFMALSQVQVEVILHCEGDLTRIKRSLAWDALGPYDYGSNKWILTDTISFNSRRSLVNIIVNDINDNAPIFVGHENEFITVGYPVPELAERVLPRSLAELQATDADIGENAALLYWSSAPQLAVAPTTGFVHLRDGATLENLARFTIHATDRFGQGLTGSIDIVVRLLNENYIAVVTVRDAFLDDEENVISSLSEAVGYEVKVLRSVVISDEVEAESSRKKRAVTSAAGASLQLYVYGLIAREPVSVQQLTLDISNIVTAPVIIASSVSLQDHLEGQEICVYAGRDTGLLVATIVLSVLLFIVLVLIGVWFFLRWRKNRNYDEFSDERSLASRDTSEDKLPKPEVLPKPRLDIAELKRSEKRLQEMLDAPVEDVTIEPTSSRNDAILDMSEQMTPGPRSDAIFKMPEPMTPTFIQSIDKLKDAEDESSDDEFGEVKIPRRKSVVTFNENVEKIIHVEDTPDAEDLSDGPNFEVYKL